MKWSSIMPITFAETVLETFNIIRSACEALTYRTCDTTLEFVKNIGFEDDIYDLVGPAVKHIVHFEISKKKRDTDYNLLYQCSKCIREPESKDMKILYNTD